MAVQCAFHSFMIQTAENSVAARKILEGKGVVHYRDLCASHVERQKEVVCRARMKMPTAFVPPLSADGLVLPRRELMEQC